MVRTYRAPNDGGGIGIGVGGGGGGGGRGGGGVPGLGGMFGGDTEVAKPRAALDDTRSTASQTPVPTKASRISSNVCCESCTNCAAVGMNPRVIYAQPAPGVAGMLPTIHQDQLGNIIIVANPAAQAYYSMLGEPHPQLAQHHHHTHQKPTHSLTQSEAKNCQNCQKNQGRNRSMDNSDIFTPTDFSRSKSINQDSFSPAAGGTGRRSGMRTSNSEGFLGSTDQTSNDLSSELEGTLARLQNTVSRNAEDHGYGSDMDTIGRKSASAPNADLGGGYGNGSSLFDEPRHNEPPAGRRNRSEGASKSGYRRELQAQISEQQTRREREKSEDRFGLADPMEHLHRGGGTGRSGGSEDNHGGAYSPSIFEHSPRRGATKAERDSYKRELVLQMQEQRVRKEAEKQNDSRDWWEKREEAQPEPAPNAKPHPSQPRANRKTFEEELNEQIEAKKRQKEEEKRKEKEEDERFDRRLKEQQDKMKREYEEEAAKKKAKEVAKEKRQEDLIKKQNQLQEEMDRSKKEARDAKMKSRQVGHVARNTSPTPSQTRNPDEDGSDDEAHTPRAPSRSQSRVDSAPLPNGLKSEGEEAADQLSGMREHLERQEEEHDAAWNGLVEV